MRGIVGGRRGQIKPARADFDKRRPLRYGGNALAEDGMRTLLVVLAALLLSVAACQKSGTTGANAEIETAIKAYLEQRPNVMLANMTLELKEVKITEGNAEASVTFRSKQQPEATAEVLYQLRREDGHWRVVSTGGMGGDPHGATPAMPADHPPTRTPSEAPLEPSH